MDLVWDGLRDAVRMLARNEGDVYEVAWRSIYVSGTATLISLVLGVCIGSVLAFRRFRGRLFVMALVNTGMGFPPVVIGLIVALMLWRSGPLGELEWIYKPRAMILAQVIIATPVISGFTAASLSALHPRLKLQVYALGASRIQMLWLLLQEVRLPLLAALMAGFGAAISEVGASMIVGGNIKGDTRVLTGAIVLENSRGNFGAALAFGIILLGMMIAVNLLFTWVQIRGRGDGRLADAALPEPRMTPYATWLGR